MLPALASLWVAAGAAALAAWPADPAAWWAGEVDLRGARRFQPPRPDPAVVAALDLERVHRELWPDWVAAPAAEEAAAYARLYEAVRADPYLAERVARTRALARADPVGHAQRLLYQVWAWNRYCDLVGAPWRLTAGIHVTGPDDAVFYVKSYRIISDTPTRVGGSSWRTRVVQRVDDLSAVEGYLGLTGDHEEGAVVVAERVADFAIDRVWPLLDAALDPERSAVDAAFAPRIRADAGRALPAEALEVLGRTAADRFWMQRAVRAVHDRARCGSRFRIPHLPYAGLDRAALVEIRRYAAATASQPCPDVTEMEAMALTTRSRALRATAGLAGALEALNGWVARAVAIHEARHAADDAAGVRCADCPGGRVGRLEASAYLASFADPDTAAVALLQACAVGEVDAAGRGATIAFVLAQLDVRCEDGPPEDLAERARAAERRLFGRSEEVALDPAFPARLPLERDLGPQ